MFECFYRLRFTFSIFSLNARFLVSLGYYFRGNLTDALKTGLQNVPWDGTPQQKVFSKGTQALERTQTTFFRLKVHLFSCDFVMFFNTN